LAAGRFTERKRGAGSRVQGRIQKIERKSPEKVKVNECNPHILKKKKVGDTQLLGPDMRLEKKKQNFFKNTGGTPKLARAGEPVCLWAGLRKKLKGVEKSKLGQPTNGNQQKTRKTGNKKLKTSERVEKRKKWKDIQAIVLRI